MRAGVTHLLIALVFALHSLVGVAGHSLRSSLIRSVARDDQNGDAKLNPWKAKKQWAKNKQRLRTHMLARELPSEEDEQPVEGCIACFGTQVVYGKYQTEDGDQTDNSYFLFKRPQRRKDDELLPVIVHFHHGGFFSGEPWKKENSDIKAYVSKGFAVVSVGYRLVTDKYVYTAEDGENKTEELIHVSKDGKLSLDAEGRTMEDYKVSVGKAEFITKYLYDATQMIESLIENADRFGLDVNRIVFVGESTGGAGMQYLTWVYHQWNVGRYTPRGMVYHNAQLNYPVHNMLDKNWDLFVETMGPLTKLSEVMSLEACPVIIGNHMCGSPLGETSDYELCNHKWNKRAVKKLCSKKAMETVTLGEVQKMQVWKKEARKDAQEPASGLEKLWYNSENIQKHLPHDPFYLYVANTMNGTGAVDIPHHSIFALNFAKYAEMAKQGGMEYTVYYTDFAHMSEADQGMARVEVSRAPGDLGVGADLALPPSAWPGSTDSAAAPAMAAPGAAPAPGPSPAVSLPAPAPAPAPANGGTTIFNYLSTHNWREDFAGRDTEVGSAEERILYACLAAGAGPFREIPDKKDHDKKVESGSLPNALPSFILVAVSLSALLSFGA